MLCTQLAGCDIGQQAGMGWEMNVWPCFAPRPRRERRNNEAASAPRTRLATDSSSHVKSKIEDIMIRPIVETRSGGCWLLRVRW
jgi:hypothetical protein